MIVLYENFNTTNQTQPRYEAHENFVADIKEPGCSLVDTLPYYQRCTFIRNSEFCVPEVQLINYLELYYCTMNPVSTFTEIAGAFVLCLMLSYLFLLLGIIADRFFCPSLTMLSKTMGMSEALAGVTLLAFGNGAPDLFTAMASLTDSTEIGLQYSELIGAGSFVTAVVAGSIIIVSPFQVFAATCARDYLFLIFTILYLDTILYTDDVVTIMESLGILVIYIIYIIVVCIDQYIYARTLKVIKKTSSSVTQRRSSIMSDEYKPRVSLTVFERESTNAFLARKSLNLLPIEERNIGLLEQFLKSINPLKLDEWKETGYCGKFCKTIQLPFILLTWFIPIADFDEEFSGWTKLLNCLQLVSMLPLFIKLVLDETFHILSISTVLFLIVLMIPVALFVFKKTKTNKTPEFHFVYAIIAASLSIGFISFVANEIILILMVLGIVLDLNASFLGCTLLAWGNSVGDLVTNITLAKQGYQKMGFAACIGGPLFNILMSTGITFLYKAIKNPDKNNLSSDALSTTNEIFLIIILISTLMAFTLTEFQARRSIGILLLSLYLLCFFFTIINTLESIHPYGTDHSAESGF